MSVDYAKLLAPLVGSIVVLGIVTQVAVETLGLILRYAGGAIAVVVIGLYVVLGGYTILIRGLAKIGNFA